MSEALPFPVILARRVLTSVSAKELQAIAVSWIESGHESPDLHALAWDPVLSWRDADPLFDAAASALGFSQPSRAEAAKILVYYHLRRIAQGHCTPDEGLDGMMQDAYWPELSDKSPSVYAGGVEGLEKFMNAYWDYHEQFVPPGEAGYKGMYGEAAVQAFNSHLQSLAAEWVLRHPLTDGWSFDGKPC